MECPLTGVCMKCRELQGQLAEADAQVKVNDLLSPVCVAIWLSRHS